jgi:Putative peptidoglycan binding domain
MLSILISLLACTDADAITLPGHAGHCPQLAIGSADKQCVAALQRALNGMNLKPLLKVTGNYDTSTFNNVKKFQLSKGLSQDGIVGQQTAGALGRAWRISQAKNRQRAARAASTSAAPSGGGARSAAATHGGSSIITPETVIFGGIFILLALAIVVFAKRLRSVNISITKRIAIIFELAPTDAENKLETLRLLVRAWEVTAAETEAEAYLQVVEFLNEALLVEKNNEKPRGIHFRKRKMIEGRVEKDFYDEF